MDQRRSFRIAVGGTVALLAAAGTAVLAGPDDQAVTRAVDDVAQAVAATFAAAMCARRARRGPGPGRPWALLAGAAGAWAAGQVVWSWLELVEGWIAPFPSVADVGFVASLPLGVAGLVVLGVGERTGAGRVRLLLDGVLVASSGLFVSWATVLGPAYASDEGGALARGLGLLYPVGDVVVVSMVAMMLARARRSPSRRALALVGAGFAAIAVADSAFAWTSEQGTPGGVANLGWIAGFALVALGALAPAGDGAPAAAAVAGRPGLAVPYGPLVLWMGAAAMVETAGPGLDPFLFWDSAVVVIALVGRQLLALADNAVLARDLEAKVAARTAELATRDAWFAALERHATDVVAVVDESSALIHLGPSAATTLGWERGAVVRLVDQVHPDGVEQLADTLRRLDGDRVELTFQLRHADGGWRTVEAAVADLRAEPAVRGIVLNLRDVTERRSLEDALRRQALHDPLTGLANRVLFHDRLAHTLSRPGAGVGLLLVDVDGFSALNRLCGHDGGDAVLVEVARRVRATVRQQDTVARMGADQFVVMLDEDEVTVGGACEVAERLVEAVRVPMVAVGRPLEVRVSVGVAAAGGEGGADELVARAVAAVLAAKQAGGDRVQVHDEAMFEGASRRRTLELELRHALVADELVVHYQPLVDAASGIVTGAEALVRWEHPRRGLVPPGEFIPLAESTGLVVGLGEWVLRRALCDAAGWPPHLRVSVNVSPRQLDDASLVATVRDALASSGVEPGRLTLEVTESRLLADLDRTILLLDELRTLGVKIAIDDFGTGFSSLIYLDRLPVDTLKIDRAFVAALGSGNDRGIVTTIVDLAARLGLTTVAEGVEGTEQLQILRYLGADVIQGFVFARPMAEAAFRAFVQDDEWVKQVIGLASGAAAVRSG